MATLALVRVAEGWSIGSIVGGFTLAVLFGAGIVIAIRRASS